MRIYKDLSDEEERGKRERGGDGGDYEKIERRKLRVRVRVKRLRGRHGEAEESRCEQRKKRVMDLPMTTNNGSFG